MSEVFEMMWLNVELCFYVVFWLSYSFSVIVMIVVVLVRRIVF